MRFLRSFSGFRLAFGVLGTIIFRHVLKSLGLLSKTWDPRFWTIVSCFRCTFGFRDLPGELQKQENRSLDFVVFFSVERYAPKPFVLILVSFVVSFWAPGTHQKRANNINFMNNNNNNNHIHISINNNNNINNTNTDNGNIKTYYW